MFSLALVAGGGGAAAQTVASSWADHEHAKSRLVAARHDGQLIAFVEIAMPEGWKTYWRNPGDAGGLPPSFDFKSSDNVSSTRVLFPAPKRLVDHAGETIGYKGTARFPVEVAPTASDKPVDLRLKVNFGVCREICVPLEAEHALHVPVGVVGEADGALAEALAAVPKAPSGADALAVTSAEIKADEAAPVVVFTARVPGDTASTEMFVEAPEGLYVPMPKRVADAGGKVTFQATFSSLAELKQIAGQPLRITLVHAGDATETVVMAK